MTEQEAKLILDVRISRFDHSSDVNEALEVAKTALEEIQQYRALGTVKELREAREKRRTKKIIINTEDDRQYEDYICPNCKNILQQRPKGATAIIIKPFKYCWDCGQAIDWSDAE